MAEVRALEMHVPPVVGSEGSPRRADAYASVVDVDRALPVDVNHDVHLADALGAVQRSSLWLPAKRGTQAVASICPR